MAEGDEAVLQSVDASPRVATPRTPPRQRMENAVRHTLEVSLGELPRKDAITFETYLDIALPLKNQKEKLRY